MDTIFALSSGRVPAGVAIVRVSGPSVRFVLETLVGSVPESRMAVYTAVRDPRSSEVIDRAVVLYFPSPRSFTGEDTAEFQLHGSYAVVRALGDVLCSLQIRPAEAGEFTRRAFENGRMDLTAVEGLADLIAAETDAQRRQALALADGAFARRAASWRDGLIAARAAIEADLDFSDEEDVSGSVLSAGFEQARAVRADIEAVRQDAHRGERLREGFTVALMGRPNAGKSSLMNALARRDVAIVTDQPGTTRDVLEVHLDLGGAAVNLIDTAGIRDAENAIEAEGIRRGRSRASGSDFVLWLDEAGEGPADGEIPAGVSCKVLRTKADLDAGIVNASLSPSGDVFPAAVSALTGAGLDRLIDAIADLAGSSAAGEPALVSRERQRRCLDEAVKGLDDTLASAALPEVAADHLRRASDAIGRLTGRIDIEDVLGSIFSSFCIGK